MKLGGGGGDDDMVIATLRWRHELTTDGFGSWVKLGVGGGGGGVGEKISKKGILRSKTLNVARLLYFFNS